MRKSFIAIGGILLFLVVTSFQSYAEDLINGCYRKTTGKLRIVNAVGDCAPQEVPISWNMIGPQGETGPQGEQGPTGECDCPITQEQLDELIARIEYLESLNREFNPRFTDLGNGTIRDNDSGLIWLKDTKCFDTLSWPAAMDAADLLANGDCGLTDLSVATDWRLPTKDEWQAFRSTVYENPALVNTMGTDIWSEGDAFTGVGYYAQGYWSSTEISGYAYMVWMASGDISAMAIDARFYVWPVRRDH